MSKLRKIMAMVLSCMMLLSVISITAMADDGQWTTVELDNTKKKQTIEVNLEQDMWYSWFLDNDSEGEISVTEISEDSDVIPRGQFSAGISGGVNSTKASEPLKKGKYTFVIEALGENNLNGVFRYMFTNDPENISIKYDRNDGPKLYVREAQPIVVYDNTSLEKAPVEHILTFAANPDNEIMYELQKYGIIEGDPNGDFRPYTTITRAEMAKVLCKVLGLPKMDNGKSAFSDMTSAHWAYGYIEAAYASGLIDGNEDGTFAPDNDVKFSEAVKMIVTALGYKPMAEQRGGFPHGYAQIASQNGITKDIDHALDVSCKRNIVFKMLHNALDVPRMIQTGFGANAEYAIADGKNNTPYQTLRSLITGTEIIPGQNYDKEYLDELNKFMEGGEYYDEIAAELEEFWKPEGFNGTYTFEIVYAELNSDATNISLKVKITPDNGEVCYVHLGYAKVDGKWKF